MTLQARIYTCLLLLGSSIAAKPKLRIEPQAGNIYLNEDKVFLCKAEGVDDVPDIRWINPSGETIDGVNERFQLNGSDYDLQLTIQRARREDSGKYTCVSDSGLKSIDINVISSAAASLHQGPGFDSRLGSLSVWSFLVLSVSVWVSSGCSGFLPQSERRAG
ncbi:neural cell adhesion molecule 1-A-like [Mustelus asterias]